MSEIKVRQFWIYKGTSNHCSQLEYDYETDTYEKSTPDGFYDYVCTKDTVQGGIHVLEAEPVLKLLREMGEALRARNYHDADCADALESFGENESCECGNSSVGQVLDSYKSFLASIDKGE